MYTYLCTHICSRLCFDIRYRYYEQDENEEDEDDMYMNRLNGSVESVNQ